MGYNLPDHELFILNREYGISYRKLAEEWKCGQSTIGNHVRQFEELLENGEPKAIALYEVTSMKFKSVPEYIDMIEDMKIEQNDNYTDEIDRIVDANFIDKTGQLLGTPAAVRGLYGGDDKTATETMIEDITPWYKRLYDWLKWW